MNRTRTIDTRTSTNLSGTLYSWKFKNNNLATTVRVYMNGTSGASFNVSPGATTTIGCTSSVTMSRREGSLNTISDEQGPDTGSRYNECSHTVTKQDFPIKGFSHVYEYPCVYASGSTTFDPYVTVTYEGSMAVGDGFSTNPSLPSIKSSTVLRTEAEPRLNIGTVTPDVDLPQFVGELEDFRALYEAAGRSLLKGLNYLLRDKRSLTKIHRTVIDKIGATFNGLHRSWLGSKSSDPMTLRSVGSAIGHGFDTAINLDLAYKLAFQPFMRDMTKLWNHHDRFQRFINRLAKPSFHVHRASAVDASTATASSVYDTGLRAYRTYVGSLQRTVTVWAMVQYSPLYLTHSEWVRAFYALYPRASVAWELTPLTFVIDAWIDIGRFIRQFENRLLVRTGEVSSSGYSVKDITVRGRQLYLGRQTSWAMQYGAPDIMLDGEWKTTQYQRFRTPLLNIPTIEPVQCQLPSMPQIATMMELVAMAFRRRR